MTKKNSIGEKTKLWVLKFVSNYWLFGILIYLLGVDISCHICNDIFSHEGIVLTFIGILATFIVVSNYAQVKSVEDKAEKYQLKLDIANDKIDYATILFAAQVLNKRSKGILLQDKRNKLIILLQEEFPDQKFTTIKDAVDHYYKFEYGIDIANSLK